MSTNPENSSQPVHTENLEDYFAVESDKRIRNFVLGCAILGAAAGFYVTTVEILIPFTLSTFTEDTTQVVLKLDEMKKDKPEEKKKQPDPKKKSGASSKPKGKGDPKAPNSQGVLKLISSKSRNSSLDAYDLLDAKFNRDIQKVIDNVSGLTKTGETRIGGRRGKSDAAFNEGFAAGGSGGIDDLLGGLLGGDSGPIGVKAKGNLRAPTATDIDMGQSGGQRSTESILRVIRQHTPGLRHTYNKYLKIHPGFQGKVTVRFAIAPGGAIVDISIVSSTTGVSEFDAETVDKIRRWRFEPIQGKGNDVVTVPFTFSE